MPSRTLTVQIVGDDASLHRAFRRSSTGAKTFDRDIGRATRGALAGSGVFRGLGRSIAFASGGFLAFATAGQFLRTSIDAAKEAQVTQAQLAAQFKASGKNLADYRGQIEQTTNRLSLLAGFENDELKAAFTTIFRATGNVSKALRDTGLAADIARAKHIALSNAATLVAKVEAGNVGLLRRQGVQLAKNATVEQALTIARLKFLGQAKAGTTEQERFGAVLHNTEEIIGLGLLPTLNKFLAATSIWLTKMNESGKLQRDVSAAAHGLGEVLGAVATTFRGLNRVTGSTANTLKLLAGAFLLLEVRAKLIKWGLISGGIRGVGASAVVASGEVSVLSTRLAKLRALGPFVIPLALSFIPPSKKGQEALDKAGIGFLGRLPIIGGAEQQVAKAGQATHDFLFGKPKAPGAKSAGISPSQAILKETFEQAKLLNPKLTRKAFELGQAVAKAFIDGTNKPKKTAAAPVSHSSAAKRLSLAGRFNLSELALANAGLTTGTTADDVRVLRTQAAIVRLQLAQTKTLKDRIAKTQQLGGILSQIASLTVKTETKSAAAVKKHADEWVKLGGKIQAIPHDMRSIVDAAKKTAAGTETAFQKADLSKLVGGLGLSAATRKALEARFSQVGAGGTVPRGSLAAPGGGGGARTLVNHTHVYIDGKEIAPTVTRHQQKASRRNPGQRRGPHAGQ